MNSIAKILFTSAFSSAFVLSAVSCTPKEESPALTAVKDRIAATVGEGAEIQIYKFEKVDSMTYGQELENRKKLFNRKLEKIQELHDKYVREHKPNNAQRKKEDMERTKEILAGLAVIEERIKDSLNVVAYYDYFISGKASNEKAEVDFPEYYASMTKTNEVLYMQSSKTGLHRTNGRVIPGYTALLKGDAEEEEPSE